jgi:AhpD family alkylhydroperoxidase
MEDLREVFTTFKKDFSAVYEGYETLGKIIDERAGSLPEKVRWLIKVAVSGASGHTIALEIHVAKARKAGAGKTRPRPRSSRSYRRRDSRLSRRHTRRATRCGTPAF